MVAMRFTRVVLFALCLSAVVAWPAQAARRALVIGNDLYRHLPRLHNAGPDASAIAASLHEAGFPDLTLERDLDHRQMLQALHAFAARVQEGDDVMLYYAGHGVQIGATSFLVPVDVRDDAVALVQEYAVSLQGVLEILEARKPRFTLVVIDACRNNPFGRGTRGTGSRGLAPTAPATGQMLIYSAGAHQLALDRLNDADREPNGVFTRVLLRHMRTPDLPVHEIARRVREEVRQLAESVRHEQVPALYDQSVGLFYFRFPGTAAVGPAGPTAVERLEDWRAFRDCPDCPEMVVMPGGPFVRHREPEPEAAEDEGAAAAGEGSPPEADPVPGTAADTAPVPLPDPGAAAAEAAPMDAPSAPPADEAEAEVEAVERFALGRYEVTRGEFRRFVEATGRRVRDCRERDGDPFDPDDDGAQDWTNPGFEQNDEHPVVCVSWEDAHAYTRWLSRRTGRIYRLVTGIEWEYAARAGTDTPRFWGESDVAACGYASVGDRQGSRNDTEQPFDCDDGYPETAPVGSFRPNAFGLYDLLGNAAEWVEDCWYDDDPEDRPHPGMACASHEVRGGAWDDEPVHVSAFHRSGLEGDERRDYVGFRVARSLR